MELYDLTLKKEVARESAWGIMGTINRIENKKGEIPLLKIIEKNFWEKLRKIPKMSSDEIDALNINSNFMMKILLELEEM